MGAANRIWDRFCKRPGVISATRTRISLASITDRYRDDVALMGQLALGAYRFSVSWPRVQPSGSGAVNQAGLDFYSRLVDELLAAKIAPWVVLYHWDLPQARQDAGGWPAAPRRSALPTMPSHGARARRSRRAFHYHQ